MENFWIVSFATVIFLGFGYLFYRIMRTYVKETYGPKWLKSWVNRAYFGQSLVFMSTSCTALLLYLLKCGEILTF